MTRIEERLDDLRTELSAFVFTAARQWRRSLQIDPEQRDLLCAAIDEYLDQIKVKS